MLELLTLGILAAVVLVKLFTLRHMQKLTHEKIALDQAVANFEHRYKMMREKRQENEKTFYHLTRDRSGLEAFLQKLQENLADQQERNRDLEKLVI